MAEDKCLGFNVQADPCLTMVVREGEGVNEPFFCPVS